MSRVLTNMGSAKASPAGKHNGPHILPDSWCLPDYDLTYSRARAEYSGSSLQFPGCLAQTCLSNRCNVSGAIGLGACGPVPLADYLGVRIPIAGMAIPPSKGVSTTISYGPPAIPRYPVCPPPFPPPCAVPCAPPPPPCAPVPLPTPCAPAVRPLCPPPPCPPPPCPPPPCAPIVPPCAPIVPPCAPCAKIVPMTPATVADALMNDLVCKKSYAAPYPIGKEIFAVRRDPYTGIIEELTHNVMPPPTTERGERLPSTLCREHPRMTALQGGYNRPFKNSKTEQNFSGLLDLQEMANGNYEQFWRNASRAGQPVEGTAAILEQQVREQRQLLNGRDLYHNKNGFLPEVQQMGKELPFGFIGNVEMARYLPALIPTQKLDLVHTRGYEKNSQQDPNCISTLDSMRTLAGSDYSQTRFTTNKPMSQDAIVANQLSHPLADYSKKGQQTIEATSAAIEAVLHNPTLRNDAQPQLHSSQQNKQAQVCQVPTGASKMLMATDVNGGQLENNRQNLDPSLIGAINITPFGSNNGNGGMLIPMSETDRVGPQYFQVDTTMHATTASGNQIYGASEMKDIRLSDSSKLQEPLFIDGTEHATTATSFGPSASAISTMAASDRELYIPLSFNNQHDRDQQLGQSAGVAHTSSSNLTIRKNEPVTLGVEQNTRGITFIPLSSQSRVLPVLSAADLAENTSKASVGMIPITSSDAQELQNGSILVPEAPFEALKGDSTGVGINGANLQAANYSMSGVVYIPSDIQKQTQGTMLTHHTTQRYSEGSNTGIGQAFVIPVSMGSTAKNDNFDATHSYAQQQGMQGRHLAFLENGSNATTITGHDQHERVNASVNAVANQQLQDPLKPRGNDQNFRVDLSPETFGYRADRNQSNRIKNQQQNWSADKVMPGPAPARGSLNAGVRGKDMTMKGIVNNTEKDNLAVLARQYGVLHRESSINSNLMNTSCATPTNATTLQRDTSQTRLNAMMNQRRIMI